VEQESALFFQVFGGEISTKEGESWFNWTRNLTNCSMNEFLGGFWGFGGVEAKSFSVFLHSSFRF
jgi:hypothetical protein